MKCKECPALDHELCTAGIFPTILKKSKQLGCSLNSIQVNKYIQDKIPTYREYFNNLLNEKFIEIFGKDLCLFIRNIYGSQRCPKYKCKTCKLKFLKEKINNS